MPTPRSARTIAIGLFEAREGALSPAHPATFRRIESGAARANDLAYAKMLAGKGVDPKAPDAVRGAVALVPAKMSFPQSFLADIDGTRHDGSHSHWALVIRRTKPGDAWRLALIAPHAPMAGTTMSIASSTGGRPAVDVAGDAIVRYADGMQYWADHATPDAKRWSVNGLTVNAWFADVGVDKQDEVDRYKTVTHYTYVAPTRDDVVAVRLRDGHVLGCAPVRVDHVRHFVLGGHTFQGPGWSWWISAGSWQSITDIAENQVCALVAPSGEANILASYGEFSVRATGVAAHPTVDS